LAEKPYDWARRVMLLLNYTLALHYKGEKALKTLVGVAE
jgi:hypothetical protein